MMIKKLRVQNFRKHTDFAIDFQPGTTIITGANGSGKTSLLEAIYIALQGKSWRSNFAEILRDDGGAIADWWRVDVEFEGGERRVVKFQNCHPGLSPRHSELAEESSVCHPGESLALDSFQESSLPKENTINSRVKHENDKKVFEINTQTFTRLPAKSKKPTILFEPGDLQLLYGSPTRRRDFFDRFISQIEPAHATNLREFERILRQRNNLLKRSTSSDELFVWDLQFADLAEKIIATRGHWIKEINHDLTEEYQKIASSGDQITIKYLAPQKSRQQILDQLKVDFADHQQYTKIGPQTHDIKFKINHHDAKLTASRGENRTIIFAALAAMTKILNHCSGERVYLLFDDIDSELDSNRRGELYKSNIFTDNYLFATTIKTSHKITNQVDL